MQTIYAMHNLFLDISFYSPKNIVFLLCLGSGPLRLYPRTGLESAFFILGNALPFFGYLSVGIVLLVDLLVIIISPPLRIILSIQLRPIFTFPNRWDNRQRR